MKKEKNSKSALNELLDILPQRLFSPCQNIFAEYNILAPHLSETKNIDLNLNEESAKHTGNYFKNQNEEPRLCYVFHKKKDGILSSQAQHHHFVNETELKDSILNPEINEKELTSYLKPSRLIEEGIEYGYIKKASVPFWKTIASVITAFGVLISTLVPFI